MTTNNINDLLEGIRSISEINSIPDLISKINSINTKYPSDATCGIPYVTKISYISQEREEEKRNNEEDFENDCTMWMLQIKAFVLDALLDEDKRDSEAFKDFIYELAALKDAIW